MGSGKSTVGKVLADRLNCLFFDLDYYIVQKEKASISDIFLSKGEVYFRKIEKKYLDELLFDSSPKVVALGGGTPCYFNTMNQLLTHPEILPVYLQASIPFLTERLFQEKSSRPLIAHIKTEALLAEFIGKHLFDRNPYYLQTKHRVLIDHKSVHEIVEELLALT